jgi:membrane protein YdbS with pleckstrin-like domain
MKQEKKDRLGLTKGNYLLMLIAIIILTIAYFVMAKDEITLSPILLFIAYIIVVPLSLLIKFKKKD